MLRIWLVDLIGFVCCLGIFFALIYGAAVFGALYHT